MDRKIRFGLGSLLIIIFLWILVSVLLPVSYDARANSNEFTTYISNHNIKEFQKLVLNKLGKDYEIESSIEDIAKTIRWEDRMIYCDSFFTVHGKNVSDIVIIHFEGKRYWYKKYKWKIVD